MAKKTFISYKYSDAKNTRDRIITALGEDAVYYQGETVGSPDMSGLKTETIKLKLKDMIFPTSVIIVIISQNVDLSKWVDWEINYATNRQSRNGRQSQPNGVIMAIEDHLISSENKYSPNETTRLIKSKSTPYVCSVSSLLNNPSRAIKIANGRAQ